MSIHNHICGFYYSTYRPERYDWERHYLPQVALKSHTTILSRTSRTVLTQTFTNPNKTKAIRNVRYTFPLYDGVSVVAFTCHVGDRTIKGRVKEKQRAKQDFNEAVERGETAGLLEQLPDASDVFTTTVGNIPPGATIASEITYVGELKHDAEVDGIRFTIPTAIAPRYGRYPGELLRSSESAFAEASSGMEIVVDAVLDDGSPIKQLRSPTHPIAVSMGTTSDSPDAEPTMTKASATLSLGTAELDNDFVLQVVAKDTGNPTALLEVHPRIPSQRALMTTLVPKFNLPPIRPEVVFICDRSGSMDDGMKIPTAKKALKIFLKSLPVGVKFNICSFGSRYSFLWPKSKSYTQESLQEAIQHVETFDSDFGGTEIFEPIKATIEKRYKDMELEVMLLTDGDVWGHEAIFEYLNEQTRKQKGQIRVFTLGVGLDASSALVEGVARAGNGFSQAVGDNEKMDSKIVRMLKGALTPHITDYSLEVKYADEKDADDEFELIEKVTDGLRVDLKLEDKQFEEALKRPISLFDNSVDLDAPAAKPTSSDGQDRYAHLPPLPAPAILQAPFHIPPLFPFNRTTIYLLLSPDSPAATRTPTSVIVRGTSAHGPLELEIPVTSAGKGETIHQLSARKAVLELEEGRSWLYDTVDATGKKLKDKMPGRWSDMVEREAVRLGTQFQVGGKWCSFVALEDSDNDNQPNTAMELDWEYLDDAPTDHHQGGPHRGFGRGGSRGGYRGSRGRANFQAPRFRMRNPAPMVPQQQWQQQQRGIRVMSMAPMAARRAAPPQVETEEISEEHAVPMDMPSPTYSDDADGIMEEPPVPTGTGFGEARFCSTAPVSVGGAAKKKKTARGPAPAMKVVTPDWDDGGFSAGFSAAAAVEEEEEKEEEQTPLQALVALQGFEGCWEWGPEVLGAVGVKVEEAEKEGLSGRVAATVLAVVFLRVKLADEEEAWELVVEKAEEWVRANAGEEEVKALREKAERLLK